MKCKKNYSPRSLSVRMNAPGVPRVRVPTAVAHCPISKPTMAALNAYPPFAMGAPSSPIEPNLTPATAPALARHLVLRVLHPCWAVRCPGLGFTLGRELLLRCVRKARCYRTRAQGVILLAARLHGGLRCPRRSRWWRRQWRLRVVTAVVMQRTYVTTEPGSAHRTFLA